jgi:acyl-CoA synthetase (AMP-forming)/AMP-acid ligase II
MDTEAEVIPTFVRGLAERFGPREAVALGDDVLSYGELDAISADLACGLLARGVGKGTRVGILFSNGPTWVVWWAAISRIGGVAVPLSTFARPGELRRTIRHADLHAIVLQPTHLRRNFVADLERAFPDLAGASSDLRLADAPYLRWIVEVGGAGPSWAKAKEWVVRDRVSAGVLRAAETEVHGDDPALIIYTSGTSADPKGVVHTQRAVMAKVHYLRAMLGITADSEPVANMPFFWVGGLVMSLFTGLDAGARVSCLDATTYRTDTPIGSSTRAENPYSHIRLAPSLGMTETFGMYSWGREFRVEEFPIASPMDEFEPGYTVEVVDECGVPVADGAVGEIVVRGPTVTRQLVKVDRDVHFTGDGFFKTGDRGVRQGSRIYFVGRLGDMIKTSGANVAPPEVERELLAIDGVEAAFVTGVHHDQRGQEVVAAVVPTAGVSLDPDTLGAALRERLSVYKVPRRIAVVSFDELPMTPSNKIDRRALASLIVDRTGTQGQEP